MGIFFVLFQGDDVKELEKEKDKRVKKIAKLDADKEKLAEEVKAIDEKIAEIKSKG
ncbi:MAG: hypothetical protein IKB02_05935 [Clostridia bacterium]|jgi:ABC-type enterochelin transport system substrate-binding protein|nr:hypothetical protein [Clostridia bacterium]